MSTVTVPPGIAIIADDEPTGLVLMEESVAQTGLQALCFDNGTAALAAALDSQSGHQVAIVLLDVDMPGLNGFEVCRRLRADARFAMTPIVMVTGHEDSEAITLAFEAGATDFVAKPVNWALLPRRLEYILRNAAAARSLNERMAEVKTLVEALPDTLWVVSSEGDVLWSPNAEVRQQSRLPPDMIPVARQVASATAGDGMRRTLGYRSEQSPGLRSAYEMRFSRREGGDVLVVRQDVTERVDNAERIERLAYFDPLTNLPNRQRCMETAGNMQAAAASANEAVAVVYIDLNSLKRVNDSFGHAMGDAVLRAFADRLVKAVDGFGIDPSRVLISRLGGDEFVVVLRQASAREVAMIIAQKCAEVFKLAITHDALEFYSSPNIGVAVYPDDGADMATVFKHADTAMYHAKATSGAIASYTPAMSARMRDWLELEGRLRRAVHNDLLNLVFQPKFRISDNRLVGVEALLRWRDAEHGDISPNRFVEIAEDSGLILDMSAWVVRAVCRQLRKWLDRGIAVPVAINCSAKELLHGDPARVLEAEAAAANVPTSLIEVELTESLLIKDSATVQGALARIRQLGCRIALDDFGTGYSSLSYITRFPPDRIKIDKA
ncbi:putative bifunctional diguanylate cyclase/phosphodiesterase, partial [Steroidobacter sp.]|uniref:putative bifunctional diguanylate cyclase/phosphodiesterase n=1 Tax=Steroidobacter sp. TaxID=1978227 RepID=UPI001A3C46D9